MYNLISMEPRSIRLLNLHMSATVFAGQASVQNQIMESASGCVFSQKAGITDMIHMLSAIFFHIGFARFGGISRQFSSLSVIQAYRNSAVVSCAGWKGISDRIISNHDHSPIFNGGRYITNVYRQSFDATQSLPNDVLPPCFTTYVFLCFYVTCIFVQKDM